MIYKRTKQKQRKREPRVKEDVRKMHSPERNTMYETLVSTVVVGQTVQRMTGGEKNNG